MQQVLDMQLQSIYEKEQQIAVLQKQLLEAAVCEGG
jgi:hypothetical protein